MTVGGLWFPQPAHEGLGPPDGYRFSGLDEIFSFQPATNPDPDLADDYEGLGRCHDLGEKTPGKAIEHSRAAARLRGEHPARALPVPESTA